MLASSSPICSRSPAWKLWPPDPSPNGSLIAPSYQPSMAGIRVTLVTTDVCHVREEARAALPRRVRRPPSTTLKSFLKTAALAVISSGPEVDVRLACHRVDPGI